MKWSPQQELAAKKIRKWRASLGQKRVTDWRFASQKPYFLLGGYAGTGKTTLAKELISGMGKVIVAAYTGKAAHVLRRHGLEASTLHKVIYLPRDKCDARLRSLLLQKKKLLETASSDSVTSEGLTRNLKLEKLEKAIFKERQNLKRPDFNLNTDSELAEADLLVIDEYSMVDEQMGEDLLSFGCPILALGDPGQLPPVQGARFFKEEPDMMLTEIHRQAAGNPIIHLSKIVREGGRLVPGTYGNSQVVKSSSLKDAEYTAAIMSADQALVGLNATRRNFNRVFRAQLKREGSYPERDDKLVCLRNNHKESLLNGQTWTVEHSRLEGQYLNMRLVNVDDGNRITCLSHTDPFEDPPREIEHHERRNANEFDYGYALTVHKSQGSQWDHVVLLDEWRLKDRAKWLYTGITRAAQSITIIQA